MLNNLLRNNPSNQVSRIAILFSFASNFLVCCRCSGQNLCVLVPLWVEVSEGVSDRVSSRSISTLYFGGLQIYLRETLGLQYVSQLLKLRKGSADNFTQQKVNTYMSYTTAWLNRAHYAPSSHTPGFLIHLTFELLACRISKFQNNYAMVTDY